MISSILILLLIPLLGIGVCSLVPAHQERFIALITQATIGLQMLLLSIVTLAIYIFGRTPSIIADLQWLLFQESHYRLILQFHLDTLAWVFLIGTSLLFLLVLPYSRVYLHREKGYKRYFLIVLLFYTSISFTVLANNLETLFIGWEFLGITSFLLIAFYRDRFLPIKNASKVYSLYRIGDICLLLAMWLAHQVHWQKPFQFHSASLATALPDSPIAITGLGILLIITAAIKSAQFPFSTWLPRAMEGPSTSSAIFYGAITSHLGVFLLLRTHTLWTSNSTLCLLIASIGIATCISGSIIVKVQSSIKSQIAYGSILQIGLMFIELSLGAYWLVVIHFISNAVLRTYQVLASPSVVSLLTKEQTFQKVLFPNFMAWLPEKWRATLYTLAVQELLLDTLLYHIIWYPFKALGRGLSTIPRNAWFGLHGLLLLTFVVQLTFQQYVLGISPSVLAVVSSALALSLIFSSYANTGNAHITWIQLFGFHIWTAMAIAFNDNLPFSQALYYLGGAFSSYLIGVWGLERLRAKGLSLQLTHYHGHASVTPRTAFIVLIACLGITGFPITPTFLGEELLWTHVRNDQFFFTYLLASGCILSGISAMRFYGKLFYGSTRSDAILTTAN